MTSTAVVPSFIVLRPIPLYLLLPKKQVKKSKEKNTDAPEARVDKYRRNVKERVNFEYDLVSIEAKYHEKCFSNFLSLSGKGDVGRPLDENIRIAMDNAFHYMK
ncbi:hypothetical protein J6590_061977 [Homalodisca vitripennis]|nr:hypothetical protein J6590_061977 [Homalodisca vitripennis]